LVKQAYFGGIWVLTMRKEVIFTKVLQKGLQNNIVLGCFSSSRTGEDISLGIGMKVIHYLLMGAALLFSVSFMLIRSRRIRVMK